MSQSEKFKLLSLEEVDHLEDPGWLVHEAVPARTLVQIFGKQESGKTFIALDMALKVASGLPWMGDRGTRSGKVVYVAGEGISGLKKRILAWRQHYNKSYGDLRSFWVIQRPVELNSEEHVRGIIDSIDEDTGSPRADLIVFDTQARCTPGVDENSAQEMGVVVAALDYIKEATGATLVLVHHTPHNEERGRGSTAIPGAVDTIIGVKRSGRRIVVSCHKQKDWEAFEEMKLVLEDVPGTDFPVPLELSGEAGLSDSERKVLALVRAQPGRTLLPSHKDWWDELDIGRTTFYRCIAKLKKLNLLADVGDGSVRAVPPPTQDKPPSVPPSHTPIGVGRGNRDVEPGPTRQNVRLRVEP